MALPLFNERPPAGRDLTVHHAENTMALTLPAVVEQSTIPKTMRSAVLFGPQDIRVIDRPVPQPGPGEVLVQVAMCGTCGTDLKIYDGHFPLTLPYGAFTPGHEWTGTVVALGETVDEFVGGDRVCIEAHHGCGRCDNCLIGKYTACLRYGNTAKGHRATGMTADGGFAEYVLHHVSSLYKMPTQVSFPDAVLITTAGTGLYGLDAAGGYIVGYDIAIFGPGPVGLMTVQACKQLGAARVILVGTRPRRLEMGRRLGADYLINVHEQDPVVAIQELTGGAGVDLAIECSGALETPQQCVQVTKRGGKMLVVAFYAQPVTLDLSAVVRSDITIYTTRGEGGNNVKRAVSLAAQGRMRGADLVTHEFPLEEIAEAFRVMRQRIDDPIKIVIVP
jgi:L-iditol 2-dehydrogenase